VHEEIQNRSEVRLWVYKDLTNNYLQKWKFSKCSRHGHEVDIVAATWFSQMSTHVYSKYLAGAVDMRTDVQSEVLTLIGSNFQVSNPEQKSRRNIIIRKIKSNFIIARSACHV
jgi:hypothetical protein